MFFPLLLMEMTIWPQLIEQKLSVYKWMNVQKFIDKFCIALSTYFFMYQCVLDYSSSK